MLSVKDIQSMQSKRRAMKKELYRAILKSFSHKITTCVELGQTQAFLTVPQFVMGFPTFNRTEARTYIARQMSNLGYSVTLYGDFELYVSWVKGKKDDGPENQLPVFANLHKLAHTLKKQKGRIE